MVEQNFNSFIFSNLQKGSKQSHFSYVSSITAIDYLVTSFAANYAEKSLLFNSKQPAMKCQIRFVVEMDKKKSL